MKGFQGEIDNVLGKCLNGHKRKNITSKFAKDISYLNSMLDRLREGRSEAGITSYFLHMSGENLKEIFSSIDKAFKNATKRNN